MFRKYVLSCLIYQQVPVAMSRVGILIEDRQYIGNRLRLLGEYAKMIRI